MPTSRRGADSDVTGAAAGELQELRAQVRRLTEELAAERAHTAELDGQLRYALLTVGRLRARLREVGVDLRARGAVPARTHR